MSLPVSVNKKKEKNEEKRSWGSLGVPSSSKKGMSKTNAEGGLQLTGAEVSSSGETKTQKQ